MKSSKRPISYQDAGVSIDEGDRAVSYIRGLAAKTFNKQVLSQIGGFGGGYHLKGWKDPVLVSSIDGVGTKLKVAVLAKRHDTVGQDLVNHCVNDIMVQGAQPLFFLDYFAAGKLQAEVVRDVVAGIALACRQNGCALIGGETAEMPGMYAEEDYDLAGCIVGVVEKKRLITGARIQAGDVLVGLPSTGLHTNGYSLARKLLFEVAGYRLDSYVKELGTTVAEALLAIHRSYRAAITTLHDAGWLKGAAHITGGGITENLPRILPAGLAAQIDTKAWTIPPLFELLRQIGQVPEEDYRRTFNLGVGMIFAVSETKVEAARALLARRKERSFVLGVVVKSKSGRRVIYT
ncbi:MAG: phosphoribosylformylglycinamidine cyclo-ligase [Bryobacteraceae bacterium]|nr:phosphoribosylformylglycinamidine cyclo-ligase [Bryobacteraceae bacterium]MDW8378626.1 phosphoribosylformylglycinamidine cyclo-ligase [Bryobacterales bacterium]